MGDSSAGDPPQTDSGQRDPEDLNRAGEDRIGDRWSAGRDHERPAGSLAGAAGMLRFAGAGMELGGSAILGAAIGYAIDRYLENTTLIATALGTVFGFAAGLYRFIRLAMAANRSADRR